jgi:hypothetical protein
LHNDEIHNFHSSSTVVRVIKPRRMRWAGHVARFIGMRNAYKISVGMPDWKIPLGRRRRRLNRNII